MNPKHLLQFFLITSLILTVSPVFAWDLPSLHQLDRAFSVEEEDGSPSVMDCKKFIVSDDMLHVPNPQDGTAYLITSGFDNTYLKLDCSNDPLTGALETSNGSILANATASGVLTLGGTGGTNNENLTFDFESTANEVGLGTGTGVDVFDFGNINCEITSNGYNPHWSIESYNNSTAVGPFYYFYKSHSNTVGTKTTTVNNELLGAWYIRGVDLSSNWDYGMSMEVRQDGAAGNFVPCNMKMYVCGQNTYYLNQFVLRSTGNVSLMRDNEKLMFGAAEDASIYYDGSDMYFDSQEVGNGGFIFQNGNVGIGTTGPKSVLHIGNTDYVSITDGLSFGDGDTGFYEAADDTLYVVLGNVARWKWLADAIIGIKAAMHIECGSGISTTVPRYTFYNDNNTGLGTGAADELSLITGGTERMRIDDSGNVGIGTTSPTAKLEVNGDILVKDKIAFTQDDKDEYIDSLADGYLDLGATASVRINDILHLNGIESDPASPADGDLWYRSDTDEYRVRANGVTYRMVMNPV